MTNNILIEATPYNPATSSFVTVRMTLFWADDRGTQLNGYQWMPVINGTPITTRRFASDGVAQAFEGNGGEVGFVCAPQFGNQDWATLQWDGATFSMFVAPIGAPWAEYRQVLSGTTSAIKREGAQCSINLSGSEATLNRNLLTASYAGTGNAEGPSELKGTLKPFAAGDCLNIEPILIDPVRFIYQFHGYGAAQDVTAVYEQALTLGPASTTASTYNSLRDATLQPGEWIKAPAIGCFRLGAEPTGKITADIKGGKDGSTYPASIATIVPLLIKAAGVPAAKIKTASFAAFSAVPWSYYTKAQVQIGDVARDALQQAGGYLMADGQGNWQVGNYYATSTATALREDRSALPLVRSIVQNEAAPPVYRVRVGYNRCWAVHSADEISPALSEAQDDIIAAKEAADAAKAAADAAQADADQALQQIDNIGADGILDRAEKAIIVREFQQVTAERAGIESRASGAGITTLLTAYTNAYNTLSSYLSGLSPAYTDTTQNTSITRSTWNTRWNGYYTARQALLNEIARLAADMVGSLPASTVAAAVTNFNTRNDRNAAAIAAPTIATDGSAITATANTDGSADIRFAWNWAGSNDDIDGFRVIVRSSTSSSAYTLGGTVGEEQAFELPADRRAFSLYGTAADRFYTFYVQAYRVVDPDVASGGLIVSTAVKSTRSGDNPYRPSATVNFLGSVAGVAAATLVAQAQAAKPIDTAAPSQVTGLTVTSTAAFDAVGGQIITLNIGWTASTATDLAGYSIEIAQGASSTNFIATANVGKTATSYAYSAGILANTVYRVRVAAYDDSANLGNWSSIVNVTTARDTAAPAAPTAMTAAAEALDAIQINWTNPTASDLDHIDIYEHTSNSSASATKIATVNGSAGQLGGYRRSGLPASALRYYWTKAVDTSGNASGFSAVASATVSKGVNLDDFDPTLGVKIPQGVTSLPNVATWTGSSQVWVDGTLYELKAGAWKKAIDMAAISGQVVEAQISNGSISNGKLGPEAVKTPNIAPLAITAGLVAQDAITKEKIVDGAIDDKKLATNSVVAEKIAKDAVSSEKIPDGAIITAKLFDGAVNSNKLATGSVVENKIGLEAVTNAKLGPNSVSASKLVVADVTNYVQDPTFSDEAYWVLTRGTFSTDSAAITAMAVPKAFKTDVGNGTTSQADSRIATQASQRYSIEGGASYRLNGTWYVTSGFTGMIQIVLYWYRADGSGASTPNNVLTLCDYRSTAAAAAAKGTNNLLVQAPVDAVFAKFDYKVVWSTSVNNAGYGYAAYPILNRAMSSELIVDGSIIANKIAANSIDASKVAAGSITASKLLVGDTSNMVTDANCVDTAYWTAPGGVSNGPTGSVAASTHRLWAAATTTAYNIASSYIPVEPGKDYFASLGIGLNAGTATVTAKVDWYSRDVSGVYAYLSSSTIGSPVTSGTLNRVSAIVTAPATARACMILASKAASAAAAAPTLMEPVMRRAASGEMIVDGSITATKVATNAITANHIAAGSVTATKVFIGDTSNMVPDPGFNDTGAWTGTPYVLSTSTSIFASDFYLRIASSAAAPQQVRSTAIPVEKSTAYAFSGIPFTSSSNTATATIAVEWYSDIAATALISTAAIGSGTGVGQTVTNTIVTAPANARRAKILLARTPGTSDTGEARFANLVMRRAATGDLIVDGSITADKIAANSVDATKIIAGSITARHMVIGDMTNLVRNDWSSNTTASTDGDTSGWSFNGSSATNWVYLTDSYSVAAGVEGGAISTTINNSWVATSPLIPAKPGQTYRFEVMVFGAGTIGDIRCLVQTRKTANSTNDRTFVIMQSTTVRDTWLKLSGTYTVPATGVNFINMQLDAYGGSGTTGINFARPVIRLMNGGDLIVDGSITAEKVAAKAIVASKLAIGDTSNMVPDPNMSDLGSWRGTTVTSNAASGTYTSARYLLAASTTDRIEFGSTAIQVEAGKEYYVSAGVRISGAANPSIFLINWYSDADANAYISNSLVGTNSTGSFFPLLSGIVTAPANARTATMQFIKDTSSSASGLQAVSPIFRRASSGELIVDGSIVASKIAVGAITANKMSVTAGGNVAENQLPAGMFVGSSGDTIGTVQTQASGAFDGTAGYRVTGVPSNNPTASTITVTANANGTRNIRLDWAAYTQGTRKADLLMLFWRKASTTPTVNDSAISINVNTAAASYYIFEGVNPTDVMSFGIAAARRTENGIEVGAIQTVAAWTNVATATANYTGNISGTSAATIRANALNPASVINSASTTIDPGKITITGTTTLADWRYGNTTTIDGGFIATNTITANAIAANTITANKLVIGDASNMADNGWSKGDETGWTLTGRKNFFLYTAGGVGQNGWWFETDARDAAVSREFSVTPGESYYFEAWCRNLFAGNANIYAFLAPNLGDAPSIFSIVATDMDQSGLFIRLQGLLTIPAGITSMKMALQSERTATGGASTFWGKPILRRAMSGELIVDGAITASKIKAGEIISDHITVGTLAGDRIAGRTIGADRLVAGSISVNEMGANSISANQLQTNAVTAAKIKAGEITGDKINSATSLPATLTISGTGFSLGSINNALGNATAFSTYNGNFAAWAGSYPDGYNSWGNSGSVTKVTGERGGNSVRITATANGQNGMVQTGDGATNGGSYALYSGRWIIIEADITLNGGNLQGAGILVRATGGADTYLNFANDPDAGGFVAGNGNVGQSYSYRKMIATNAGNSTRPEMYLMNHYGGIGNMATANDITWHRAGWRYATEAEMNPAKQVNAASTQIDPGKILISGSTSLASWRNGGDNTKIEGGSIAANTITANKLTLGNRNIGFIGFNFEWNPTLNRVEWSNGYIYWQDDNNNLVATLVAAGNTGSAVAHQFIYWTKGASTFSITQNHGLMISDNTIQVAAWWGGTQLNVNYGGTIMHGDRITTGTIQANRLSVGQLSAITADMGTVYAGMIRNNTGSTQFDVTNGRIIFNNGSVMKVSGSGFGTNNQFIEWFGPALANINQCSESNATSYLRNDGSAYFGGALLAGTLRNTNATSVLTNNASTTIGPFGSNGNQIVVNASWSWSSVNRADYPANATGRNNYNSAISTLQSQGYTIVDDGGGSGHTGYKSDNKDSSQFALTLVKNGGQAASEGGCTGYIGLFGVRPEPADGQPGFIEYTYTYSKSLTYTDPERSTAQRTFTASITRNFTPSGTANQRVGVNTVE